jgi:hypothetical protein
MLNHDGSHHEHFEELCALAASGQISEPEFVELQDHLRQCASCRSAHNDFVVLLHDKLPLADPDIVGSKLPGFFSETSSYRERFLARARKEGVAVSPEASRDLVQSRVQPWFWPKSGSAKVAMVAAAVLLVTVGILSYGWYETNVRYRKMAAERTELSKQLSQQSSQVSNVPEGSKPTNLPPREAVSTPTPGLPPGPTQAEIAEVRSGRAAAEVRSKILEDQLSKVVSDLEALRAQNEETNVSREQLEKKLKEAEAFANAVKDNFAEIREARSKDSLTIATQDLEIEKLSEKLTEQAAVLEQEKNLLDASRDVRELMGARNFHVADVYDVDSRGKDQRAFGRVFYTEGKTTLILYAFDLNDQNTAKRNASFQVWGKRGPSQVPTHSLGLLQIDDQKQNRWVLRVEDSRILAEIDSVFVTVEPPGGSARPTGRQFLYAYLNTNRQ